MEAQYELLKIFDWSNLNGLKNNTNKTKGVLFKAGKKQAGIHQPILLSTRVIEIVDKNIRNNLFS